MARSEALADTEMSTLVVPASQLRWRAPELSFVLSERAVALAASRHDEFERLRAESLAVSALNQLGRSVLAAERASAALHTAEAAGEHEFGWCFRIELAECARIAGIPLAGFALLHPVLFSTAAPRIRAAALVAASGCLAPFGRSATLVAALDQADQLYASAEDATGDDKLIMRAMGHAAQASQHRGWGDTDQAVSAARDGIRLLNQLTDPTADSGHVVSRLEWELVAALVDAQHHDEALTAARDTLQRPVRAAAVEPMGRIKLAVATKIYSGTSHAAMARELLWEVADSAERYQLDGLLAESMIALAHACELAGAHSEALGCLRNAHGAERRLARSRYAIRVQLADELPVHAYPAEALRQLEELLSGCGRVKQPLSQARVQEENSVLLTRAEFLDRLDIALITEASQHAISVVLLEIDPFQSTALAAGMIEAGLLTAITARVRAIAPPRTVIGRVGDDELAILLLDTTGDQAKQWADELRSEASQGLGVSVRSGVAAYRQGDTGDHLLAAAAQALSLARNADHSGAKGDSPQATTGVYPPETIEQTNRATEVISWRRRRTDDPAASALAQAADRWRLNDVASTPQGPQFSTCQEAVSAERQTSFSLDELVATAEPGGRRRKPENSTASASLPPASPLGVDLWSEYQDVFNSLDSLPNWHVPKLEPEITGSAHEVTQANPKPESTDFSSAATGAAAEQNGRKSSSELADLLAEAMAAFESGQRAQTSPNQPDWSAPGQQRRRRHAAPEPNTQANAAGSAFSWQNWD